MERTQGHGRPERKSKAKEEASERKERRRVEVAAAKERVKRFVVLMSLATSLIPDVVLAQDGVEDKKEEQSVEEHVEYEDQEMGPTAFMAGFFKTDAARQEFVQQNPDLEDELATLEIIQGPTTVREMRKAGLPASKMDALVGANLPVEKLSLPPVEALPGPGKKSEIGKRFLEIAYSPQPGVGDDVDGVKRYAWLRDQMREFGEGKINQVHEVAPQAKKESVERQYVKRAVFAPEIEDVFRPGGDIDGALKGLIALEQNLEVARDDVPDDLRDDYESYLQSTREVLNKIRYYKEDVQTYSPHRFFVDMSDVVEGGESNHAYGEEVNKVFENAGGGDITDRNTLERIVRTGRYLKEVDFDVPGEKPENLQKWREIVGMWEVEMEQWGQESAVLSEGGSMYLKKFDELEGVRSIVSSDVVELMKESPGDSVESAKEFFRWMDTQQADFLPERMQDYAKWCKDQHDWYQKRKHIASEIGLKLPNDLTGLDNAQRMEIQDAMQERYPEMGKDVPEGMSDAQYIEAAQGLYTQVRREANLREKFISISEMHNSRNAFTLSGAPNAQGMTYQNIVSMRNRVYQQKRAAFPEVYPVWEMSDDATVPQREFYVYPHVGMSNNSQHQTMSAEQGGEFNSSDFKKNIGMTATIKWINNTKYDKSEDVKSVERRSARIFNEFNNRVDVGYKAKKDAMQKFIEMYSSK